MQGDEGIFNGTEMCNLRLFSELGYERMKEDTKAAEGVRGCQEYFSYGKDNKPCSRRGESTKKVKIIDDKKGKKTL